MRWLHQQVETRLAAAMAADTGEPWEADKHYDALWVVDFKPSLGPVDLENWQDATIGIPDTAPYEDPRFAGMFAHCAQHVEMNQPRNVIADCEADRAILREHYILWAAGSGVPNDEQYDEYSVVTAGIPGGAGDQGMGCVTCHYKGFGAVQGYGICRTVKAVATGYRHRDGYAQHWGGTCLTRTR